MKKVFALAALAALTLVACNEFDKPTVENQSKELSLNVVSNINTKGYVNTEAFTDSTAAAPAADRTMMLSAYMTPQSGASANYFVGQAFAKNANGETDNMWHHSPKIYWPIGGDLDFLAYSSTIPFAGTALNWDNANAASKCVLYVSEDYLQDDVIYAYQAKADNPAHNATVDMTFFHTQAWIEFKLKVGDASMDDIVKIKDITITNLYTRGELTLTPATPLPSTAWNFTSETARDFQMQDTQSVLAEFIHPEAGYTTDGAGDTFQSSVAGWGVLDMLIPQQQQTSFLMHYTLAGQDTVLEYEYILNAGGNATWQAGKKYVYDITINPYEIIVNPSVTAWDPVLNQPDGAGNPFPSVLE